MRNRRQVLAILGTSLLAATAQGASPAGGFFSVHQSEPLLLHRVISQPMLTKLLCWDSRLSDWRQQLPEDTISEGSSAYILHLWADYCAPCREEFPILRELVEETDKKYAGKVRWIFLSETAAANAVQAFFEKYRARMPKGPQYLDTGEAIANLLGEGLTTTLSYPVTLVLDSQHVVRHAFVGRVRGRRAELLAALDRMVALPR